MSIVYVMGTRPNFVKLAPVVRALRTRLPEARHVIVHTEQHYDATLSDVFFDELSIPLPDYTLDVGSGRHGAQTARALERIEEVLLAERPTLVIVAGDVNSTLAGALAAAKLGVPLAHVEAGLRSFDRSMPEEINRVLVDQVSDWCFIHSPEARVNLRREAVDDSRIHFVGNTMIDTLTQLRPNILASDALERIGVAPQQYVLVTLHRPALVDGELLADTVRNLLTLSDRVPVVFPVHPRTRNRLGDEACANLRVIEPLGYVDFLALESSALAVVTDSGGVQEESTFLRVPCFTLRANTERPVTISQGTNTLLGLNPDSIRGILDATAQPRDSVPLPDGWDGAASERIADIIQRSLHDSGSIAAAKVVEAGAART